VNTLSRRLPPVAAAVFALLLIVALVAIVWPGGGKTRVSAHFPSTVALFNKSEVKILGITVGKVTKITPQGETVRVDMEVEDKHKLPVDVKAVIVSPSVVADRFVQLTPPYRGGPEFRDGGVIPVDRTAVPVELDRVFSSLNDLNVALGPQGANKEGSLSRLLSVGADNLEGEGENLNSTIVGLSKAIGTLSDGREDLFGSVQDLQTFTTALARNDAQVRSFNRDLAAVADQLSGERDELSAALKNLAVALAEVNTFVKDNKQLLSENVAGLAEVTGVLAKQKKAMEEFLEVAPIGLSNLGHAFDHNAGALGTRGNQGEMLNDFPLFLCTALTTMDVPNAEQSCKTLEDVLGPLPNPGDLIPHGGATRAALQSPDLTLGGIVGAER
jgi:phospholipid/cholesterol/gamma-HCH transport system substrate-binding protein